MNKQKLINISLIVMLVLSFSYVVYDVSMGVRNNLIYSGYEIAIHELISQAENERCEPFSIFYEDKNINLVNVDCLQQQAATEMPDMDFDAEMEPEMDSDMMEME